MILSSNALFAPKVVGKAYQMRTTSTGIARITDLEKRKKEEELVRVRVEERGRGRDIQ